MRMRIFLMMVTLRIVEGVKLVVRNDSSSVDCSGVELEIILKEDVQGGCSRAVQQRTGGLESVFRVGSEALVLIAGRESGVESPPRADETRIQVGPSKLAFSPDMLISEGCGEGVCVYDTRDYEISRPVIIQSPKCGHLVKDIFSVKIEEKLGSRFCSVFIDSKTAHFDAQIAWIQASLLECPCREADYVFVYTDGDLDDEVMNLLKYHAIIDVVFGGESIEISSIIQIPASEQVTLVVRRNHLQVIQGCHTDAPIFTSDASKVDSKRNQRIKNHPAMTVFSSTDRNNIFWSLILAVLAGVVLNVSLRKSLVKRSYEAISTLEDLG